MTGLGAATAAPATGPKVATALWIIAAKTTQKEMHQVAEDASALINDIKGAAQETLFNPGLIVAAVVVAALVLKRR